MDVNVRRITSRPGIDYFWTGQKKIFTSRAANLKLTPKTRTMLWCTSVSKKLWCKYLKKQCNTCMILPDLFNGTTAIQTMELIWKRLIMSCYHAMKVKSWSTASSYQQTEDFFFRNLLNYESKKHDLIKVYHTFYSVRDF